MTPLEVHKEKPVEPEAPVHVSPIAKELQLKIDSLLRDKENDASNFVEFALKLKRKDLEEAIRAVTLSQHRSTDVVQDIAMALSMETDHQSAMLDIARLMVFDQNLKTRDAAFQLLTGNRNGQLAVLAEIQPGLGRDIHDAVFQNYVQDTMMLLRTWKAPKTKEEAVMQSKTIKDIIKELPETFPIQSKKLLDSVSGQLAAMQADMSFVPQFPDGTPNESHQHKVWRMEAAQNLHTLHTLVLATSAMARQ